jgi:hypothetical protein
LSFYLFFSLFFPFRTGWVGGCDIYILYIHTCFNQYVPYSHTYALCHPFPPNVTHNPSPSLTHNHIHTSASTPHNPPRGPQTSHTHTHIHTHTESFLAASQHSSSSATTAHTHTKPADAQLESEGEGASYGTEYEGEEEEEEEEGCGGVMGLSSSAYAGRFEECLGALVGEGRGGWVKGGEGWEGRVIHIHPHSIIICTRHADRRIHTNPHPFPLFSPPSLPSFSSPLSFIHTHTHTHTRTHTNNTSNRARRRRAVGALLRLQCHCP